MTSLVERVSVIITTFNVENYIYQAIQSVIDQTYKNIEIVIVDDCSTDQTVKIIKKMNIPNLVLRINNENKGPSYSRNKAISLASGEWIAILDGDDWWDKERIEMCMKCLCETHVDIVCDNILYIMDGQKQPYLDLFKEKRISCKFPGELTIEDYIVHDLGIVQPIIRKEFLLFNDIKYFDEYKYGEDFLFLLDCLLKGNMYVLSKSYYYYRKREGSLVHKRTKLYKGVLDSTLNYIEQRKNELTPRIVELLKERSIYIERLLKLSLMRDSLKSKNLLFIIRELIEDPFLLVLLFEKIFSRTKNYR